MQFHGAPPKGPPAGRRDGPGQKTAGGRLEAAYKSILTHSPPRRNRRSGEFGFPLSLGRRQAAAPGLEEAERRRPLWIFWKRQLKGGFTV
ncbi:hypothetical protein HMPREF0262_00151 [Clostridium sp. ATCC 29733]|nr:hypothetical protein HMPREF0262_00151 [Clostridium sp. ATCC 29733]